MRSIQPALSIGLLVLVLTLPASARVRPKLVQRIGPIAIAGTQDSSALQRLLGDGCYVENEGHLGGRYYANTRRSLTFHAEFGVDWRLESIDLREGLHVPDACTSSRSLVTKHLDGPIVIQHGVRLGMGTATLIKLLGTPTSDKTSEGIRVLSFETTNETDERVVLFYDAHYAFRGDRLFLISIRDGE